MSEHTNDPNLRKRKGAKFKDKFEHSGKFTSKHVRELEKIKDHTTPRPVPEPIKKTKRKK